MQIHVIAYGIPVEVAAGDHTGVTLAVDSWARGLVAVIYLGATGAEKQHSRHFLLVAGTMKAGVVTRNIVEHLMAVAAVTETGVIFPIGYRRCTTRTTLRAVEGKIDHRVEAALSEVARIAMTPAEAFAGHPEIICPVFGIFVGAIALAPCLEGTLTCVFKLIPA